MSGNIPRFFLIFLQGFVTYLAARKNVTECNKHVTDSDDHFFLLLKLLIFLDSRFSYIFCYRFVTD